MERTTEVNNRFYDDLGDRWYTANDDPVALLRAEGKVKNAWIANKIGQLFPQKKVKVLDIGCGGGFLSNDLAKQGHQVTGLDASPESLKVAERHDSTRSVNYEVGDAYSLPFEKESFDVVCMMDFLEHVEFPEKIIAEGSRVLKKNGALFFHTFNRNLLTYLIIIKGVEWFVKNTPPQMHLYSYFIKPNELKKFCHQNGLQTKEVIGIKPKIFKKSFWKMLYTKEVPHDFEFILTDSTLMGYLGFALKS